MNPTVTDEILGLIDQTLEEYDASLPADQRIFEGIERQNPDWFGEERKNRCLRTGCKRPTDHLAGFCQDCYDYLAQRTENDPVSTADQISRIAAYHAWRDNPLSRGNRSTLLPGPNQRSPLWMDEVSWYHNYVDLRNGD